MFVLQVLLAAGLAGLFLAPGVSFAGETIPGQVMVAAFSRGDLSGWSKKIFTGETAYSIVQIDGRKALKAVSKNSASGLVKKIEKDPEQYPLLRWSWKIEHTLKREDATKKTVMILSPGYTWSSHEFFSGRLEQSITSGRQSYQKVRPFPTPIL